jgi:hypothetical protein
MQIDRRITNGLAWAGVILVVGVPVADLVAAQFAGPSAGVAREQVAAIAPMPAPLSQRPEAPAVTRPAAVAATRPAATPVTEVTVAPAQKPVAVVAKPEVRPAAETADVVDAFLKSGKPLPSYITGAQAPAAPAQAAATETTRRPIITAPDVDPVEVASIPPQRIAPVPMPLSMRPQIVAAPVVPPTDIMVPPGVVRPPANVTARDLADWESGPLTEFLAARQGQGQPVYVDPDYDPDGFFLDQGPNQRRGDRVVGWQERPFSFFGD